MTSSMPQKSSHDARDNYEVNYYSKDPKTFPIRVHVNNDTHEPGKKVYVRASKLKNFENFLEECTEKIKPPFGAVRRIYTARGRHRLTQLEDFQEDGIYVATGTESFKKHNYREIPERQRVHRHKGFKKIDINKIYTPVQHAIEERLRKKSGRSYYLNEQNRGLILRVHVNGYYERPACPVSVSCKDRDNMYKIKERIESVLGLQPINKILTIINQGGYAENFVEVNDTSELEHMGHYLVLPNNDRKLKAKIYPLPGKNNFSVATSPRSGQYYLYPSFPWDPSTDKKQYKHNQSLNKHNPLPSIGSSSKQSDAVSPFSNPPSQHGRGGRRSKGRAQHVDYDKDEGGLYRAKGQNNARGAQQVKDTYETQTERPIDQMEAEEVEEERLHTEKGTPIPPGTELHKQPSIERKQSNKGTEPLNEVTTDATHRGQGGLDSSTYRIRDPSPIIDHKSVDQDMNTIKEEAVDNRNQFNEADYDGGQNGNRFNEDEVIVNKDDSIDHQIKDGIDENVEEFKDNDKGQATNWDDDEGAVPKEENVEDDNVVQNTEIAPDKRSTGSQVYTPPNQIREEERTSEDQAASRIQAGARGNMVRKEHAQRKAEREQEHEREKEQEGYDVDQDRYDDDNADDDELRRKQDQAATTIQAGYRGYKYRSTKNATKLQGQK